jgi:hypothetical protein
MNELDILLAQLAEARTMRDGAKDLEHKLMEEFKVSPTFSKVSSDATTYAQQAEELETSIRSIALAEYHASGSKAPHPKVAVKIFKSFNVTDAAQVIAWVKTNLADALTYNPKKVKDYATKIGAVQGTEVVEEPRAQIASDL